MAILDSTQMMFTAFEPKLQNRFLMDIDGIPAYLIKKISRPSVSFGEVVLEWFPGKGIKCSRTNRAIEVPEGIGFHKGVRILHPLENTAIIESVLKEARNADYPPEWSDKILEKF